MKKESLLIIVTAVLLLLAGKTSWGAAQQQENNTQGLIFSDLTLEIAAPKEEFNQLEPIPLVISLSNKKDRPILGHTTLNFTGNYIQLFVNQLGSEKRRIEDLTMVRAFVGAHPQKILPGNVLQEKQLIDLDLDKIFPYPGEYQLQAELLDVDGKKTVKSNHLRIRILEPTGLNRQAFEFIKNNSNPSYFLNGYERVVDNKPLSILEEFVSRFSETAYGDYAVFQLGEVYFSKEDYKQAIKHLEKVAKKSDFVFAEKVKDYLSKAKDKISKSEN
jgi:TolA-binding protein